MICFFLMCAFVLVFCYSSSLTPLCYIFFRFCFPFCFPHFTAPNSANADFANFDAFGQSSGASSFGAFPPSSQTPTQPLNTGSLDSTAACIGEALCYSWPQDADVSIPLCACACFSYSCLVYVQRCCGWKWFCVAYFCSKCASSHSLFSL